MNSTNDKVKGIFNAGVGAAKEAAGKVVNNKDLETEGSAQKNVGKGQQLMGSIKEKIHGGTHDLGDNIEKVGKTLREKGHLKTGSTIEKVGDKIEHIAD